MTEPQRAIAILLFIVFMMVSFDGCTPASIGARACRSISRALSGGADCNDLLLHRQVRQVRGYFLDLPLVLRRSACGHGAGLRSARARTRLELMEPIEGELRWLAGDSGKARAVARALRAMAAEARRHIGGAGFGEPLARHREFRRGRRLRGRRDLLRKV